MIGDAKRDGGILETPGFVDGVDRLPRLPRLMGNIL
jgi:hypothetical protein